MANLHINNLQMQFSGVVALDDVSFSVKHGEIFSLIGSNGSGKSTLFNCINGFNRPQKGTIEFDNINLLTKQPHEIIQSGIARTFQNIQNIPFMTVLDNILLGAHHRIDSKATVKRWLSRNQRKAEEAMGLEILDFLGIVNYEQKYMTGQPYGIQKLTEIARALVGKPKLILMDEPISAVDIYGQKEFFQLMKEITNMEKTILMVTHDVAMAIEYADNIISLVNGKIAYEGASKDFKNSSDPYGLQN